MKATIHTSVIFANPKYNRSYAPAFINGDWDLEKMFKYLGPGRGTEVDLIEDSLYMGAVGRMAMAVDGKETVVYRVTGDRLFRTVHFEVDEDAELRTYDYLLPKDAA